MKKHLNEIISDADARANLERRFLPKVDVRSEGECWPWIAKAVTEHGYGRMTAGRRTHLKSHRVAFALAKGAIPDGIAVMHTCDNPACCNPAHLTLGTQAENLTDMRRKRRGSKPPTHWGERHHNSKFDAKTALQIARDARPAHVVAAEHNISEMTVYRLRKGITWKQLQR